MLSQDVKQKFHLSLFILILAFAIFYFFTLPQYNGSGLFYSPVDNIKTLSQQKADYEEALRQVDNYLKKISKVNEGYNNFLNSKSGDDLRKMIPESVDPVEVINELSYIASKNSMLLLGPRFADDRHNTQNNYITLTIDFGVTGTYPVLKAFLRDLETSQRIYNLKSLSFTSSQETRATSALKYQISLETYSLKN